MAPQTFHPTLRKLETGRSEFKANMIYLGEFQNSRNYEETVRKNKQKQNNFCFSHYVALNSYR